MRFRLNKAREIARFGLALSIGAGLWLLLTVREIRREVAVLREAVPRFEPADIQSVAVVATYEAQVFPEPWRSQAYRAIAWSMRNRVATGYLGVTGYSDARLLAQYTSYSDHAADSPDVTAVTIARQVLAALTSDDDPTAGARHYVDNSYWTGTHAQTGQTPQVAGGYCDLEVQQMVREGRFVFSVEWKSSPDHPRGLLFYGLYFFYNWPPPIPTPPDPAVEPPGRLSPGPVVPNGNTSSGVVR